MSRNATHVVEEGSLLSSLKNSRRFIRNLKQMNPVHAFRDLSCILIWTFHLRLVLSSLHFPSLLFVVFIPVLAICFVHLVFDLVILVKYLEDYTLRSFSLGSFLHSPITLSLSASDIHLAARNWNTLRLWQKKYTHLVITTWLCGPQVREISFCYRDCDPAVRMYWLGCSFNSMREPCKHWRMNHWGGVGSGHYCLLCVIS